MLNVSINLIWRNFLDRGFFVFRWVKKKVLLRLFGHFCPDLKHNFNIWCKYIGGLRITPPCDKGHFFVFRDIRNTFWENFFKQKPFLYCWATFWQHFFVATTNSNKKQQMWKKWQLLLLVVATNFYDKFFFIIMLVRTWHFLRVRAR